MFVAVGDPAAALGRLPLPRATHMEQIAQPELLAFVAASLGIWAMVLSALGYGGLVLGRSSFAAAVAAAVELAPAAGRRQP